MAEAHAKCKICGVRHRLSDPHVFEGSQPKPEDRAHPSLVARASQLAPAAERLQAAREAVQAPTEAKPKLKRGRPKGDTDRKAYMKTYMAKKRAKEAKAT